MNETQAREAICAIGASIFARGLTAGSSGNISVRLADGYLMTPTGAALGRLDPARLAKLDADGRPVAGPAPTKESFLHRVMYEERPGAGAVVHLHSTHAVAVSCLAEIDPADVLPPITARSSPAPRSKPPPMRSRSSRRRPSSTCCCAAPRRAG